VRSAKLSAILITGKSLNYVQYFSIVSLPVKGIFHLSKHSRHVTTLYPRDFSVLKYLPRHLSETFKTLMGRANSHRQIAIGMYGKSPENNNVDNSNWEWIGGNHAI
jgi:hypothetical protein